MKDNAVFYIHRLGSRRTLDGAKTTDWTGELPRNGDYVIVVSGTRGNATYSLEIAIGSGQWAVNTNTKCDAELLSLTAHAC